QIRSLFLFLHPAATSAIYTLSLHDALPISIRGSRLHARNEHVLARTRGLPGLRGERHSAWRRDRPRASDRAEYADRVSRGRGARSEEHTSELQSRSELVCRLLLEKKKDWKQ